MKVKGKRVGLVDDIVSTGETLQAMGELVRRAGGTVAAKAALLVEGDDRADVHHLGILPVFKMMDAGGGPPPRGAGARPLPPCAGHRTPPAPPGGGGWD